MAEMTIQQAMDAAVQHHQAGRLSQAEVIYRQILAREPNHADALHLLGVLAHQVGRNDIAVDLIGQGIALKPNDPEAHNNLGVALMDNGKMDEAIVAFRQTIVLRFDYAEPHNNLGSALRGKGQLDEAVACYRQAIAIKPDYAEAYNNLGVALSGKGQLDQALAAFRQAIALKPNYPEAHSNLGNILRDNGQPDEAVAACRQAIALKPDYAVAYLNLGVALNDRGRLDEAVAAFRQVIALQPNYSEAHSNLGSAMYFKGELNEAIAAYRRAIALKPDNSEAFNNLGDLWAQGQLDDALAATRQAIALKPDYPEAHNNLGVALKDMGELDEAMAHYRRAITLRPGYAAAHSNLIYVMHYHPGCNAPSIAEEHHRWNHQHAEPLKKFIPPHGNDRDPERRLRIGYVSPDLWEHPVGRFLLPLLAHHDKKQVEIFAYAQVMKPDSTTQRLRSSTDQWRNIMGLSDARVADLIRQDQIDILVDLAMHTAHNRLLVFARKPAPVQITYLAYCSTTGLETMDYRLSDPYLDPPGADESGYSEKTIRLPETYWCYQPSFTLPQTDLSSASTRGQVTFGCLNNFCKISEPTLSAWARLLRTIANSQLLLHAKEGSHRQRLLDQLQRKGVEPNRVRFVGKVPMENYLDQYQQIDIALDTFPYGGGTTTCDALWMGVPVVSLAGATAVGRGGLSILSNVGLPELVARSEEEYVKIASELASDLPRLNHLRSTLRQRMERSPLMDAPRFARNIEAAYRQMWRDWCTGDRRGL